MPTSRPVKNAVLAAPTGRANRALDIWAASLGVVAAGLASLIYFGTGDSVASAIIMMAAAIIIVVQLHIVARANAAD